MQTLFMWESDCFPELTSWILHIMVCNLMWIFFYVLRIMGTFVYSLLCIFYSVFIALTYVLSIYIYIYMLHRGPGGTNFLSVLCMSCAYCGLTVKLDLTSFQSFAPANICENRQSSDPLNPHYSMFSLDEI